MFEISGFDTSGSVKLKRMSFAAAHKKARELIEDGCWDVHVIGPDGRIHSSFDQELIARSAELSSSPPAG